jgi:hypothetical protein
VKKIVLETRESNERERRLTETETTKSKVQQINEIFQMTSPEKSKKTRDSEKLKQKIKLSQ